MCNNKKPFFIIVPFVPQQLKADFSKLLVITKCCCEGLRQEPNPRRFQQHQLFNRIFKQEIGAVPREYRRVSAPFPRKGFPAP